MIISVVIDRPINFSELHVPTIKIYSFLLWNVFILYVKHLVDLLLFISARVLIKPIFFWFFVYNSFIHTLASFLELSYFLCRQHVHLRFVLSMANINSYRSRSGYGMFVKSYIHNFHSRFPVRESKVYVQIPSAWIKFSFKNPSAWFLILNACLVLCHDELQVCKLIKHS